MCIMWTKIHTSVIMWGKTLANLNSQIITFIITTYQDNKIKGDEIHLTSAYKNIRWQTCVSNPESSRKKYLFLSKLKLSTPKPFIHILCYTLTTPYPINRTGSVPTLTLFLCTIRTQTELPISCTHNHHK